MELIIKYKPLTYVYLNTIETCFKTNHLLFGGQLLYSSNTTPTVVRNLTVLSSTTGKINRISNHFFNRRRHGYLVKLREIRVLSSRDPERRGAVVRIAKINTILKRPVKNSLQLKIHVMTLIKQIRQGNKSLDFEHYKY